MKTEIKEIIIKSFSVRKINKIARESGFREREPKKITPKDFLIKIVKGAFQNKDISLLQYAKMISLSSGKKVSKQGVKKRLRSGAVEFLRRMVYEVISMSIKKNREKIICELIKYFKEVIIQDSTSIRLRASAAKYYSGRGRARCKASIKINLIIDYIKNQIKEMEVEPKNCNENKLSNRIMKYIKKNSLVIRDLGYYAIKVFEEIVKKGAYFLSRYKIDTKVYIMNIEGEYQEIDLRKKLKRTKGDILGMEVYIGGKRKLFCRLIAYKLAQAIGDKRRKNAIKREVCDGRFRYRGEYKELLGWDIYITNVEKEKWDDSVIRKIYRIRWQIEIIIKTLKSYFSIDCNKSQTKESVEVFIYAKLFMIILVYTIITKLKYIAYKRGTELSIIKAIKIFRVNIFYILYSFSTKNINKYLQFTIDEILKYW